MIFYLLNKGQQTVKLLNNDETIESNLDEAINTASELKFSLPLQKRLDSNIYYILIPEYHGNDFLMFKIISEDIQKDRVEYSAVESAYDELKSYEYIKDIRPHQMNAAQMLQQVLKNTRWSLGYVEDTGIQSTTFYYVTILEAIQKVVDLFKVELTFTIQLDPVTQKITGRRVNLYQQQGRRTGKRFEYGSNLLTVTREEDSQNLVTALVGRGKGVQVSGQDTEDTSDDGYGRRLTFADVEWKTSAGAPVNKPKGQEYVEDPKATAVYGFSDGHPRIGLVTFEDIEDPNQLINATWSALLEAKRPKVSFKAEVTDVGNLQLGDTIAIIRHDLGIEYFTRVYKVHHNLKDENRNTVEMGDDFSSRSITSAISNAIQISQDATMIANTAAIAANGKNRNFYSNTKPNWANEGDNLFLNLGNGETEMWVWHHGQWEFVQSTVELHTVQKEVKEAQDGLKDAKKEIADNLAKADSDIAELNESIAGQNSKIDGLSTSVNTVVISKVTDITNQVSDVVTKVNEQKNIVTELKNQATQQGKDISKITTDIHGVTVDLANLSGDVNQTKATVQELQTTLGNAQGDIAQIKVDAKKLSTSLSGKVDNSTYANFVSATNNALNAKLVASDLNGYAKTIDVQATANGLQININSIADRMNNLKIGAENLLANTGDLKDYQTNNNGQIQDIAKSNYIPMILNHTELTHMGHVWSDWQSVYSDQEVILEKDKPYWFGFYVCTDKYNESPFGNINIFGVKKGNDLSHSKVFIGQNTEDYSYFGGAAKHWVWHTYKIMGDGETYSGLRVEGSKSKGGSAYVAGYTLVQSDVAPTGHISSLEDTKHELSQLSAQITANNQKFSSYYTKIETDSKANTAKNDAINSIKNDGNWHGLTNILTNSSFLQTSNGFTQKVQQTAQPMINSANSGGVNLLTNTYDFNGFSSEQKGRWNFEPKSNYSNNAGFALIKTMVAHIYGNSWNNSKLNFNQTIYLPAGTYTMSFLASVNNTPNGSFCLQLTATVNGSEKVLQSDSVALTYSWKTHTMRFTLVQNSTISNIRLYNNSNNGLPGGSIYFANLKLESGSLATTWCPAPEDYATQTSFSELSQTVKGLQSTVSNNLTNLQSQISQTAGTIRTEVTNRTNNLQSQITQNANNFNINLQNSIGGGKNLARGTSDIWGDSGWNNFNGASNQTKIITQVYFTDLHVGDWITGYVAYQYQGLSGNNMHIYLQGFGNKTVWNGSQFGPDNQRITASNNVQFGEFKFSFKLTEDMVYTWKNNYYNVQLRVNNAKGGWLQWHNVKFEKGTVATPWSPSPEDKVSKDKILAQINMSAGTTLIQNDKIYMDASSTIFSGKAFIPNAAITNISADKINTGTLDAGRINVINLNANNITTGTINGANLKINLNSGDVNFQHGRIHNWNNTLDINIDQNYISTANWGTRALLKDGELQLTQPNIFDTNGNWFFRIFNGGGTGNAWAGASLIGRDSVTVSNKANAGGAAGFAANPIGTADFSGLFTGKGTGNWMPTVIGGANRGIFLKGGTDMSTMHDIMDPNDGGVAITGSPYIAIGSKSANPIWYGNRIIIEGEYVHIPTAWRHTTGAGANVHIANDGALVRSTSASKYKTNIQRSYSTEYGDKLLNLPTAIWTDKGQKERYEAGKRHIKPEKYFGMIAEDLADAGLDLLVSRNPKNHEIEGIQYERIAPALLPVIKKLKDKVNRLEKQINE